MKGGYTTLVLTLIKALLAEKKQVVLINYKEGLIANELKKSNLNLEIIDIGQVGEENVCKLILPTDVLIVTKFAEFYRHLIKVNPRMIYYDINDFISDISNYKYGLKFPALAKKLIKKLLENNSLVFMDNTGLFNLKNYFDLTVSSPKFLPVPVAVPVSNTYIDRGVESIEEVKLSYIGRSVDWKLMPLKKILSDCSKLENTNKIHFSIVVDSISELKKYIQVEEYSSNFLSINLIENIPPSAINEFLLNHSDLNFSMGTSALESAKLGIPTILVDYSTKEFPVGYKYSWLFDTVNFSLGINLDKIHHNGNMPMESIYQCIKNTSKRIELSGQSYAYVRHNHASEKIAEQLIEICNSATFRLADSKKYVPYYFSAHGYFKKLTNLFTKN